MGVGKLSKYQSFLLEERTIQVWERSILITWTVGYGINTARMGCRVLSPISDKDNSGETDRWPPGVVANPTGSHDRQGIDLALYAVSQWVAQDPICLGRRKGGLWYPTEVGFIDRVWQGGWPAWYWPSLEGRQEGGRKRRELGVAYRTQEGAMCTESPGKRWALHSGFLI